MTEEAGVGANVTEQSEIYLEVGADEMRVDFVDVYNPDVFEEAMGVLYGMLALRPKSSNISHSKMPTFTDHCAFVHSRPYTSWWLLSAQGEYVGSVALSKKNEVSIQVLPQWQRRGIASGALKTVIAIADGPVFANINPANRKSQSMFAKLGFVLVQHTYKLDK